MRRALQLFALSALPVRGVFDSAVFACHDAQLPVSPSTGCAEVQVGGRYVHLLPSFEHDGFVLTPEPSPSYDAITRTELVVISQHVLRVGVELQNNATLCEGVLPLGTLSPLWACWNAVLLDTSRLRLIHDAHEDLFDGPDRWLVEGKNYTVVTDLRVPSVVRYPAPVTLPSNVPATGDTFVAEVPWMALTVAHRHLFPMERYLRATRVHMFAFAVDGVVVSRASHDEQATIEVSRAQNSVFAILVHGATQTTRVFPIPSAYNLFWLTWFNKGSTVVLVLVLILLVAERMTGAAHDTDRHLLLWHSELLTRHGVGGMLLEALLQLVVGALVCAHVVSNSVGLFWEQQLCLVTGLCLPRNALLITGVSWAGVSTLISLALHFKRDAHAGDVATAQLQSILTALLVVTAAPVYSTDFEYIIWVLVGCVNLVCVNFDAICLIAKAYTARGDSSTELAALVVLPQSIFVNVLVGGVAVHSSLRVLVFKHGAPVLWTLIFHAVFGVVTPGLLWATHRKNEKTH